MVKSIRKKQVKANYGEEDVDNKVFEPGYQFY